MIGAKYEAGGIAKMAKMVTAVATAAIPKITVIVGGSFAPATTHVRARILPALLWIWPNARIGVMGGNRLARALRRQADAMEAAARHGARKRKKTSCPDPRAIRTSSHPLYSSARLWDDGVINPIDTSGCSSLFGGCACAPIEETHFGLFRM